MFRGARRKRQNGLYALRPRGNLASPRCPVAVELMAKPKAGVEVLYLVRYNGVVYFHGLVSCRVDDFENDEIDKTIKEYDKFIIYLKI